MSTTYTTDIDPSDLYDLDRERDIAPYDYTADLPPLPGTIRSCDNWEKCPCTVCQAERHFVDTYEPGCECELDYRCGHCGPGYSPIELMNDAWAKSEGDLPWWAQ